MNRDAGIGIVRPSVAIPGDTSWHRHQFPKYLDLLGLPVDFGHKPHEESIGLGVTEKIAIEHHLSVRYGKTLAMYRQVRGYVCFVLSRKRAKVVRS